MTNLERNKWLVENVLKECWHSPSNAWSNPFCDKCGEQIKYQYAGPSNPDFFTSDPDQQAINFFRLWRAIEKHPQFLIFILWLLDKEIIDIEYEGGAVLPTNYISCPALADAIGEYWKWRKIE